MGTAIRPETSKANKYWISKHRYYELMHWCRQYDEWWEEKLNAYTAMNTASIVKDVNGDKYAKSVVEKANEVMEKTERKMILLTETIKETDEELYGYILLSVTKGKGYTYLKEVKNIPCSKNYFYDKYRKFFWLLDKKLD